jgi:transcriptional regulator with XRE-family HTH domain
VDEAPFTGDLDLDLDAVLTSDQLAALLRIVHLRVDRPSLRLLAAKTRHDSTPLSRTAVSEMLSGRRFPRKAVMIAFLRTCGLSDAQAEPWKRAWERIATAGPADEPSPATPITPGTTRPGGEPSSVTSSPAGKNPVISRRELGAALRALRTGRGLTIEEVSEQLLCSTSKVSRMENGHGATLRDIRDLCNFYGISDNEERGRLMALARRGKQQAWWQSIDVPWGDYVGLEENAISITEFHGETIPGLLQTETYMTAILHLSPILSSKLIREHVSVRLTRQRILVRDDPPLYRVILDEAALRRVCGSPEVMRQQLDRLASVGSLPNVTLQILPFSAGEYLALENSFTILESAAPVSEVVYVEGLMGFLFLERADEVARYHEAFDEVQSKALPPAESIAFIKQIAESMENQR